MTAKLLKAIQTKQSLMSFFDKVNASQNPFTTKEVKIFHDIFSIGAVPMFVGMPGVAKTAIIETIVSKLRAVGCDIVYSDYRLAQEDEANVSGIIARNENEKSMVRFTPEKYILASKHDFSIIVFEELNRAPLQVANAALQILNERRVDAFKLSDSTFLCATGNLGEEDGTLIENVDDTAFQNRLRIIPFHLTVQEWLDGYAYANVIPQISMFVESNPTYFHNLKAMLSSKANFKEFASPRSWANLSDAICMYYMTTEPTNEQVAKYALSFGAQFVGSQPIDSFVKFVKTEIGLVDIVNKFDSIQKPLKTLLEHGNKDFFTAKLVELESAMFQQNSEFFWNKLSVNQATNVTRFLKNYCDADTAVRINSSIMQIMNSLPKKDGNVVVTEPVKILLKHTKEYNATVAQLSKLAIAK